MKTLLFCIGLLLPFGASAQQYVPKTPSGIPVSRYGAPAQTEPMLAGAGKTAVPLTQEKIQPDGSAGLAYEQPKAPETETLPEQPKRVRQLRAVVKDYSLPKSTFSAASIQNLDVSETTTFKASTMSDAVRDFQRESMTFEECSPDDPNCKMYEVDEAGEVIFK